MLWPAFTSFGRRTEQYSDNQFFLLDQAENETKTGADASRPATSTVSQGHQLGGRWLDSRFLASVVILLLPLVAWITWRQGRSRKAAESSIMRIEGGSMAPSIIGTHRVAVCDSCHLRWPVTAETDSDTSSTICFHCGQAATVTESVTRGDVVQVQPIDLSNGTNPNCGDLVAVRWDGKQRVKRVLGTPGDRVDIRGPMLVVNGQRFDDVLLRDADRVFPLPWMLVDDDSKRTKSRWQSADGWTRNDSCAWVSKDAVWLVYHHRSHHDQNRTSRIWDDYPSNVNVDRKLYPVDRLRITLDSPEPAGVEFEVAFWAPNGNHSVTLLTSGERSLAVDNSLIGSRTDAPVDPEHPIAIRSASLIRFAGIKLERANQYRIRPEDDPSTYPLTLGDNEYFVVGDNTPISIDSRSIGTVTGQQIDGIVFPHTHAFAEKPSRDSSVRSPISQSASEIRPTSSLD